MEVALNRHVVESSEGLLEPNYSVTDLYDSAEWSVVGEHAREIQYRVKIKEITDVNLVRQTIYCRFQLLLSWAATKDEESKDTMDANDSIPAFGPKLEFPNGRMIHQKCEHTFCDEQKCGSVNQCLYEISGEFIQQFQLQRFPMDVQDLHIEIGMLLCLLCTFIVHLTSLQK